MRDFPIRVGLNAGRDDGSASLLLRAVHLCKTRLTNCLVRRQWIPRTAEAGLRQAFYAYNLRLLKQILAR